MAGNPSNFFRPWMKGVLQPFKGVYTKIHEATGKIVPGGNVKNNPVEGSPSADFRQVGKSPEDKSGFPTQHLGDSK